jgi:hypothetical protein
VKDLLAYLKEHPFLLASLQVWPPLLLTINLARIFKLDDSALLSNISYVTIGLTICGLPYFARPKFNSIWDWPHLIAAVYLAGWLISGEEYLTQGQLILLPALLALLLYFIRALKLLYEQHRLIKQIKLLRDKLHKDRPARKQPSDPTKLKK